MCSKSNLNFKIKQKLLKLVGIYFLTFFDIVVGDVHTILQSSYHCLKAAAKSSLAVVLISPSQLFLKVSCASERPASSLFTIGNKKKPVGDRSSEYSSE